MADRFYVYEHLRADTGAVFYIGKGQGRRAREGHDGRRSEYWNRVCIKAGGFTVRYVARDLDEELSLLVEVERIDQQRRRGEKLCNLTDGGDGISGYKRPPALNQFFSALHKGKVVSAETRAKLSASVKASGHVPTAEQRARMSQAHLGHQRNVGRKQGAEEIAKRSRALLGNKGRTGQRRSDEERAKHSMTMQGRPQPQVQCPHCGRVGGNVMQRHHFDRCKDKA